MSSEIKIRVLTFGSKEQKQSIELRSKILREPLSLQFNDEELRNEFDQIHIGAFQDGKIIGVILLKIIDSETIKMRQVAVDFKNQKQGIGMKLINFAESLSIQKSFKKIELHSRKSAENFYLKAGYKAQGSQFQEIGIPHIKMTKEL